MQLKNLLGFLAMICVAYSADCQNLQSVKKLNAQQINSQNLPAELSFDYGQLADSIYFVFKLSGVESEKEIPSLSFHWAKADIAPQLTATYQNESTCLAFQNIQSIADIQAADIDFLNKTLYQSTLKVDQFEYTRFKAGQHYITFDKKGQLSTASNNDYGCFSQNLNITIDSPLNFSVGSRTFSSSNQEVTWKINMHKEGLIFFNIPFIYAIKWMVFIHQPDASFYATTKELLKVDGKVVNVKDFHLFRFKESIEYDFQKIKAKDLLPFGSQLNVVKTKEGITPYGYFGSILDAKQNNENNFVQLKYFKEEIKLDEIKFNGEEVKRLTTKSPNESRWPDHSIYYNINSRIVGTKVRPNPTPYGIENQLINLSNNKKGIVVYDYEPDNTDETDENCAECISEVIAIYEIPENSKEQIKQLLSINMMFERKHNASVLIAGKDPVVWENVSDLSIKWIKEGQSFEITLFDDQKKKVTSQVFLIPE